MRYLTKDDFRVLTAVEMGMKNHELVPVELITQIARLRHGGSGKIMSTLLRHKLVAHEQNNYNGYRLSYLGYDILALHALLNRGIVTSVGRQIGVGKESDIFEALDAEGNEIVLKLHRLGRTSFRTVRKNRDYLNRRSKASWLYMSRLAAVKEYAFMQALYEHGFPVPTPIDHSRHIVVMSRVDGFPMSQIKAGKMEGAEAVFADCVAILHRLAQYGLIHCDFNEFNIMTSETGVVTLIDFPQMVSTSHPNAKELFDRDMNCLIKFFGMKMHYVPDDSLVLKFDDIIKEVDTYYSAISDKVNAEEDSALLEYMSSCAVNADGDAGGDDGSNEEDAEFLGGDIKISAEIAAGSGDGVETTEGLPLVSEAACDAAAADQGEDSEDDNGIVLTEAQFEDIHAIVQRSEDILFFMSVSWNFCVGRKIDVKVHMARLDHEIFLRKERNMGKWIAHSGIYHEEILNFEYFFAKMSLLFYINYTKN